MSSHLGGWESVGRSDHTVCRLRHHAYIVSFYFWESGLLDLWVGQLDALADDSKCKEIDIHQR